MDRTQRIINREQARQKLPTVRLTKKSMFLLLAAPDMLEALKDAQAVIRQLAEEGRFFDDQNRQQGLEGKINQAMPKPKGESSHGNA
jgi:hypothetical protein